MAMDPSMLMVEFIYIKWSVSFYCDNNPIYELWKLFGDTTKIELFNDFGITDGKVVILDRLNEFLEMIGKPSNITEVKGYKCI